MQVLQEKKPVKGVIQEKDILAGRDGQVTFRFQESKTHKRGRPGRCPAPSSCG